MVCVFLAFQKTGEIAAEWKPQKSMRLFPAVLNGGVIGRCSIVIAIGRRAYHLMKRAKEDAAPCTA